jgi:glycerophosphoryl diester phosphodiesterase
MQIIAHRGSMARGKQNSPAGVAVALGHGCDLVELDIWRASGGTFYCSHGRNRPSLLGDCLAAIRPPLGLVAHLKGSFADADLLLLGTQLDAPLEPGKVTPIAAGCCAG